MPLAFRSTAAWRGLSKRSETHLMHNYLDFEKPISDLEGKIHELRKLAEEDESIDTTDEIGRLEVRAREAMADIYSKLTPWQKTQVARHPQRPHFVDYAAQLFESPSSARKRATTQSRA